MKKINVRLILGILVVVLSCIILALVIYIFWESPNPPEDLKLEYDMQYIEANNFVVLSSINVPDLQAEVLEYISSLKEIEKLKCVKIRLNKDLNIEKCTFSYILADIEGYYGIFEVICHKEENWIMKSAEVSYYEGVSPVKECYYDNVDTRLKEKIDATSLFIQQNSWYEFDVYSIEIFNENIYLRATEQNERGKVWGIHFNILEDGTLILINEDNYGKE